MADKSRQSTSSRSAWVRLCQWFRIVIWFFWTTIVISIVVSIFATRLITKHFDISGTWLEWILDHWSLFLSSGVLLMVLTGVVSYFGRSVASPTQVLPTQRDRQELIQRISDLYREQQAKSLQKATLKSLERQQPAAMMLSATSLVSWRMNMPGKDSLAAPTPIVDAYDQARMGMLILGDPGVGKSTLLLELALELLTRAEQNKEEPIPVLLNLSSWALNKPSLTSWVEKQLNSMWDDLSPELTRAWFEQNELLLLLDGLDEMEPSARTICVSTILDYQKQVKHLVRPVVCSRRDEYLAQEEKLRSFVTVEVQRLVPEQVESYLTLLGKPLVGVLDILQSNAVLRELVTTPLMLGVFMLAYQDESTADSPRLGPPEDQQHQVLEHYVSRMLELTEKPKRKWRYSTASTQKWLIWLAQRMKQEYLTEFSLESLQFTWLSTKRSQYVYTLLVRLLSGLVGGLIGGMLLGLVGVLFDLLVDNHLGNGVWLGLIPGILIGFSVGLFDKHMQPAVDVVWSWGDFGQGLLSPLLIGLPVGLLVGLVGGLVNGFIELFKGLALFSGLINGLGLGFLLLGGLLGSLLGVMAMLLGRLVGTPATVFGSRRRSEEALVRLRRDFSQRLFGGVLFGFLIGLFVTWASVVVNGVFVVVGLPSGLFSWIIDGVVFGLAGGVVFGLPMGLTRGLRTVLVTKPLDTQNRKNMKIKPNQGIRNSGWNALRIGLSSLLISGLVFGIGFGLVGGLVIGTLGGWANGLIAAVVAGTLGILFGGLFIGLSFGLGYGGKIYLGHYILRFMLWRTGMIPWHYVRFLEEATDRILLQRVGGSYRFIHPLFQEYFASLATATTTSKLSQPSSSQP